MKTEKKLTPKERMEAEARIAALRAEANALSRTLKKDDEIGTPVEAPAEEVTVEETPVEAPAEEVPTEEITDEAEVAEEVPAEETTDEAAEVAEEVPAEETTDEAAEVAEEVPAEETTDEAEVAEEVPTEEITDEAEVAEEAPVEETTDEAEVAEEVPAEETTDEAEVAEEVTAEETTDEAEVAEEVPAEETTDEAAEVAEEAPVEEVADEVAEVAEDAPAEETTDEAAEVAEEAPVEEVADEVAEVAEDAPVEEVADEAEVAEEVTEEEATDEAAAKRNWTPIWLGAIAILLAAIVALLIAMMAGSNEQPPVTDPDDNNPPVSGDVTPGTDDVAFDMDAFVASTVNIANTLTTDEDVATNVDIFAEKIGADKLEELVGKYGELTVQKAIAEYIAFVPEIKMNQYINNNGLVYNPNAADDYYQMMDEADKAYTDATGKNPNGALMSLEGYDTYKSNREAMKALIAEAGDVALLTWYEAKTTGYDAMIQQNNDTEAALAYKEEVKLELVNNVNGSVKLLELQLEQNVNGTNADTLKYTDVYAEFIINNYMYVVAN